MTNLKWNTVQKVIPLKYFPTYYLLKKKKKKKSESESDP